MDTKSLALFLHLSETLHFGRSSEACHISTSALSRAIKQLENSLGVSLFERDNRSVSLTQEGKQLQNYARELLQNWDNFKDSLQQSSTELRGAISIYCSVTASYSFLYDILREFREQHPRIELKLHTGDAAHGISRITNEQEDIAIVARPAVLSEKLAFRRITISPLVFIAPKQGLDIPQSREEWGQVPLILSEEGIGRERVEQWFRQRQVQPPIYAQVAGHEALVSMVSLGFGIGAVPRIVLDNSPLADRVEVLHNQNQPHDFNLGDYDVGLCTLKKRLKSPIISAFWGDHA